MTPAQEFKRNLVGRKSELDSLDSLLNKVIKGNGSFVLISGEAGTGKTVLVKNFATAASEKYDIKYISEHFGNVRTYKPYAPFLRIITRLGGSKLQKLVNMVGEKKADSSSENSSQLSDAWAMENLYSLQTQKGLAQQLLVSTLLEASRKKTLLISFTDVHNAPLTTWQFIHYLTHSIVDNHIMIIITLRQDGRITQKKNIPVYADILQRMNRERLVEKIELNRFSRKEVREYFRTNFQKTDFTSNFLPLICEISGGLPDQLTKITEILAQHKLIYQTNSVWFNSDSITKDNLLKLLHEKTSNSEFTRLYQKFSISHKAILSYSALLDGDIDFRILSAVLQIPAIKIVKELQSLVSNKILIPHTDVSYRFRYSAFQAFLLDQIPSDSQASMHQEIALAIEKSDRLDEKEKIHTLAYHFSRSGNKISAFSYLHKAGNNSLLNFAFNEAKTYYKEATDLIEKSPDLVNSPESVELLIENAWLNRTLGKWDETLRSCSLARQSEIYKNDSSIRIQVLLHEAFTYYRKNNWQKAKLKFINSLEEKEQNNKFNKALINYGLGSIYFELSDYERAKSYLQTALNFSTDLKADSLRAHILNNLGAVENVEGQHLKAVALYSKSIPIFKKLDDKNGLARIYNNIGMTHADEKNWSQANEFYGKSLAVADEMGLVPLKAITFLNRAFSMVHMNRLEEAEEYNFKANRLLNQMRDELGIAEYYKIQGIIERGKENWDKAQYCFQAALDKFTSMQNKLGQGETELEWARLCKRMGNKVSEIKWMQNALKTYRLLNLKAKIKEIKEEFNTSELEVELPA